MWIGPQALPLACGFSSADAAEGHSLSFPAAVAPCMTSSSERRESAYFPSATARGFSVAGLVMVVLFLTVVAGSLFPIQLLEPAWP